MESSIWRSSSARPRSFCETRPACRLHRRHDGRVCVADAWTSARPCASAGWRSPAIRLRVAVHVGDNCLADAIELAAHARKAGVAAVAVAPPSYFKPATVQDLVDFCVPIAAEVEPLPFYYYHIPGMTGVRLPMAEFLYEARFRIPNLRGLKFSHDDLVDLQGCVALENGAYDVFYGFDEGLLAGLVPGRARGGRGAPTTSPAGTI